MFKLNRLISEYRIKVERAICELKCYKVIGTRRRHRRPKLKNLFDHRMFFTFIRKFYKNKVKYANDLFSKNRMFFFVPL
jgi:hypothetical protein